MRRIISRWIILATLMLLGSSLFGFVVKAVIQPLDPYDYYGNRNFTPVKTYIPPAPVVVVGPQPFQPMRAPAVDEKLAFAGVIQRAINAGTSVNQGSDLMGACDADRMADEWVRFGYYAAMGTDPLITKGNDREQIRLALWNFAEKDTSLLRPSKVDIVSVAQAVGSTEWLILAKHIRPINGVKVTQYVRWWLCERYGSHAIYDFEVPGHRLRFNALVAGKMAVKFKGIPRADREMTEAEREAAVAALTEGLVVAQCGQDWDHHSLGPVDYYDFIPPLDAVARIVTLHRTFDVQNVPKTLDAALQVWPDTPHLSLMRAVSAAEHVDRMTHLKAYRLAAGNHPLASIIEASQPPANGQDLGLTSAILLTGLTETPDDRNLLSSVIRRLPRTQDQWICERIAASSHPDATFVALRSLLHGHKVDLTVLRSLRPDDPALKIEAAADTLPGATPQAAKAALASALLAVTPSERRKLLVRYCALAYGSQRIAEAYQAANDVGEGRTAFRFLFTAVPRFMIDDREGVTATALRTMIAAHSIAHPNDPWLALFTAETAIRQKRYAEADATLAALIKTLPPLAVGPVPEAKIELETEFALLALPDETSPAFRDRCRRARVECLCGLHQWEKAYAELPPAAATVEDIFQFGGADRKAIHDRLLAIHAAAEPDSVDLHRWTGEKHLLAGRNTEAIASYQRYLTHVGATGPHSQEVLHDLAMAHLRVGQIAEAVTNAKLAHNGSDNSLMRLATVHLAANDKTSARIFLDIIRNRFPGHFERLTAFEPELDALLKRPEFADLMK